MKKLLLLSLLFICSFSFCQSPTDGRIAMTADMTQDSMSTSGVIPINTDLLVINCAKLRTLYLNIVSMGTGGVVSVQFSNYFDFRSIVGNPFAWSSNGSSFPAYTAPTAAVIQVSGLFCRLRLTTETTAGTTAIKVTGIQNSGQLVLVGNTINTQTTLSSSSSTDISSAAITSTTTSSNFGITATQSGSFAITVTSVSGTTPTMDLVVQESQNNSSNWRDVYHFERITGVGYYISPVLQLGGASIRYVRTIGGTTPSFTNSVNRINKQSVGRYAYNFFDRTIAPNTLNSTTLSYNIAGAQSITVGVASGAITTACSLQVEYSNDNSAWFLVGPAIATTASTNTVLLNQNLNAKFARVRVSTAGTGQTINYISISTN